MGYLGLNLDSLCWEIMAVMKNNYGKVITKKNFDKVFHWAKKDLLEYFDDIIEQNRPDVKEDFNFNEAGTAESSDTECPSGTE